MTLADVLTELTTRGALQHSRVPAMKTSLKYFAAALGSGSLEQCPADVACRQEATWATALEDHWRTLEDPGPDHQRIHQAQRPQRYPQDL